MARIANIAIKQEVEHYTVTIRKTIDFMKEYSHFAEKALALTGDYLNEVGIYPLSGPIVCFHDRSLEALDVEIGWQIAQNIDDRDDMHCSVVLARKIITTIDLGPYEKQDPTLMEMFEWAKENGYELQGPIYYCYLNDTKRPDEEYLTQMIIPIE